MASPELNRELRIPPAALPPWLWVCLYTVFGAFLGRTADTFWTWRWVMTVLVVMVALSCLGSFFMWWRDAESNGHYGLRNLIAVEIAYGCLGGLVWGVYALVVNAMPIAGVVWLIPAFEYKWFLGAAIGALAGYAFAMNSLLRHRRKVSMLLSADSDSQIAAPSPATNSIERAEPGDSADGRGM